MAARHCPVCRGPHKVGSHKKRKKRKTHGDMRSAAAIGRGYKRRHGSSHGRRVLGSYNSTRQGYGDRRIAMAASRAAGKKGRVYRGRRTGNYYLTKTDAKRDRG